MQLGSDGTAPELAAVREHVQRCSALTLVVQPDWLRRCGAARLLVQAADYAVPAARLAALCSGRPLPGKVAVQAPHHAADDPALGSQPPAMGPFAGCWFTLAALQAFPNGDSMPAHMLLSADAVELLPARFIYLPTSDRSQPASVIRM